MLTSTLVLASLTGAFFAFNATADEMPETPVVTLPVVVETELSRAASWKVRVPTIGELTPVEGIDVATKCAGRVRSIHFESGQEIEPGQLLVQLDDASERARLTALRARLVQARAELSRALAQREQGDALLREIDSLTAEIEEQQQLADDKRVLAPFSGQLGMRAVHVGQYLEAGATLVSLRKIAPIHVEFTLPEQRFGAVAQGAPIEVRVGALPRRTFNGTVAAIEPWIDPATRSFRLRGVLPNADGALRPGMLASVSVVLKEERDVVTIPGSAVQKSGFGSAVFVIEELPGAGAAGEPTLAVTRRYVKLGERRGSDVAVVSGIEPGVRVVVASEDELADGAHVLVAGNAPGAGVP